MGRNTGGERGEGPNGPGAGNPSGPSGPSGGGGDDGGDSGDGKSGQETGAEKGRRDSAKSSFGTSMEGFKEGLVDAAETAVDTAKDLGREVANMPANISKTVSTAFGKRDRSKSELGELGWSGPGNISRHQAARKGIQRGVEYGVHQAGLKSVASIAGLDQAVDQFGALAEKGMTAHEARGYNQVQNQQTGLSKGVSMGKGLLGPLGIPASVAINMIDYSRQADYANQQFGVSSDKESNEKGRRDSAVNSFDNIGSTGGNSAYGNTALATISHGNGFEPSSYGFGDYDSHIKGLLS